MQNLVSRQFIGYIKYFDTVHSNAKILVITNKCTSYQYKINMDASIKLLSPLSFDGPHPNDDYFFSNEILYSVDGEQMQVHRCMDLSLLLFHDALYSKINVIFEKPSCSFLPDKTANRG